MESDEERDDSMYHEAEFQQDPVSHVLPVLERSMFIRSPQRETSPCYLVSYWDLVSAA
jgi:hypothetical protein